MAITNCLNVVYRMEYVISKPFCFPFFQPFLHIPDTFCMILLLMHMYEGKVVQFTCLVLKLSF